MSAEYFDKPLFTSECTVSLEEFLKMNKELHGHSNRVIRIAALLIIVIIGDAFLLSENSIAGIIFIILGILVSWLTGVLYTAAVKKNYKRTTVQYAFYEEHFTAVSTHTSSDYKYTEMYRIEEGKNYFYLMSSAGNVYAVDKNNEDLNVFLRKFIDNPIPASTKLQKILFIIMVSGLMLFTLYAMIYSFMPIHNLLKVWIEEMFLISFLLLMIAVALSVVTVLKSRQRNHMYKLVYTIACIAVLVLLCGYAFMNHERNGDITKNTNGTYTVVQYARQPDEISYQLYKANGPLYLQYLRPMSGSEDTDPQISSSEWWNKSYPEETEEPSEDPSEETKTDSSDKISDGYTKIIEDYYPDDQNTAYEDYDAKGNSYYVVKEDDKTITILIYNRDSKNGNCGLYVLETAEKETDGSYSVTDAEIEDIYAYEYMTGKTVSSGMKDWSDLPGEEYRELTGE